MAKKKVAKTRKRRATGRRRGRSRVRGIGFAGVPMEQVASVVAGAVASKALNGVTKKIKFITGKPIVLPIIKLAAGYFMFTKSDNSFVQGMGMGFIGEGALQALEAASPDVFKKLNEGLGGIGANTTYIDLDDNVSGYNADSGVYGTMGNDSMVAGAI